MMIASDLLSYYEGYEPDFEERMQKRLNDEQERFISVTRPDYADTFEKFLDYIDEEDHEH